MQDLHNKTWENIYLLTDLIFVKWPLWFFKNIFRNIKRCYIVARILQTFLGWRMLSVQKKIMAVSGQPSVPAIKEASRCPSSVKPHPLTRDDPLQAPPCPDGGHCSRSAADQPEAGEITTYKPWSNPNIQFWRSSHFAQNKINLFDGPGVFRQWFCIEQGSGTIPINRLCVAGAALQKRLLFIHSFIKKIFGWFFLSKSSKHHKSKSIRARDFKFWHNRNHFCVPCDLFQVSRVIC